MRITQPRFNGLLFKATLAPGNEKPHFTAYFGDYSRVSKHYGDGVVLMQPLNRNLPPVVLEQDNELVRLQTGALKLQNFFQGKHTWPWPEELRSLFDEVHCKLTHPQGWLAPFSTNQREPNEPFNVFFDGRRPINRNLTFEELVSETMGYRIGRMSQQVEPNGRRPLIDYDFEGLLGSRAKQLKWDKSDDESGGETPSPEVKEQKPVDEKVEVSPPVSKKRVTIPADIADWLKGQGNEDTLRWLMDPANRELITWLRDKSNNHLLKRIQRVVDSNKPK